MQASLRRFLADSRGGSAFDYSLVAAVFAMALMATMSVVGGEASNQLTSTQSRLSNAASYTGPGGSQNEIGGQ